MELQQQDLKNLRNSLNDRFADATVIKGTRGFHYFEPLSSGEMGMKRVSSDAEFALMVSLKSAQSVSISPHVAEGKFVSNIYDQK